MKFWPKNKKQKRIEEIEQQDIYLKEYRQRILDAEDEIARLTIDKLEKLANLYKENQNLKRDLARAEKTLQDIFWTLNKAGYSKPIPPPVSISSGFVTAPNIWEVDFYNNYKPSGTSSGGWH
jgi:hypothetical protein